MHTKKFVSSSCAPMVSIIKLFGIVLLILWNTGVAVCAQVPKDDHGAAQMEYQIKQLNQLQPPVDVSKAPPGFDSVIWQAFIPQDNELTPERVSLGHKLYFDKRLSADGTVSCATCHDVTRGFTDQLAVSEGIKEQFGKRNAPTTLNVALLQTVFLDGRSPTLDHQAKMPIINPIEMGMPDGQAAVNAIKDDAEYQAAFQKAYGRQVNYDDIGRAIASFERTLIFMDSPFRRFLNGDENAISSEAKQGWKLYNEKARCVTCHPMNPSNPLGTDNRFHNVGVSARHQDFEALTKQGLKALEEDPSEQKLDELALSTDMSELGRFLITKNRSDIGAFRTPLLLNIGITPPYMHDGTVETLWDVMDHYNKGGEANLFLDGGMEPLALTEDEINSIVAFLFSLTDYRFAQENQQQLKRQKAQAQKKRPLKDDDMAFRKKIAFEK
ncbi:MAG: cytochrome c peroxidase [Sedimentisphaerales bacterium]|nr:cytochrome c peroxidase [Sedimentisphaerales bacterium]